MVTSFIPCLFSYFFQHCCLSSFLFFFFLSPIPGTMKSYSCTILSQPVDWFYHTFLLCMSSHHVPGTSLLPPIINPPPPHLFTLGCIILQLLILPFYCDLSLVALQLLFIIFLSLSPPFPTITPSLICVFYLVLSFNAALPYMLPLLFLFVLLPVSEVTVIWVIIH